MIDFKVIGKIVGKQRPRASSIGGHARIYTPKETMNYDITKPQAPKMPSLGNGTECIRLLLSQASKDMYEPLVPMLFPPLGAHMSGSEFQYPDLTWKETCGQMANLVADSGGNKGQLSLLVEAICRDFRAHDTSMVTPW